MPEPAITQGEDIYIIHARSMHRMRRPFRRAAVRVVVCPVECIENDPEHVESNDQLLAKLAGLQEKAA